MRHDLGISSQIQLGMRQAGVVRPDARRLRLVRAQARAREALVAQQLADTQAAGDPLLLDPLWPYAMPPQVSEARPRDRVALFGMALYLFVAGLMVAACLTGVLPPIDETGAGSFGDTEIQPH